VEYLKNEKKRDDDLYGDESPREDLWNRNK
jgi:hypothetical protein